MIFALHSVLFILIATVAKCASAQTSLSFTTTSFVQNSSVLYNATVGVPLPPISVSVTPSNAVDQLRIVSLDPTQTIKVANNTAAVVNGVAQFPGLTFLNCLVNKAGNNVAPLVIAPSNTPITPTTPYLVFVASVVPQPAAVFEINLDNRYSPESGKVITPSPVVTVFDSCGAIDTTATGLVITVTSSQGILGGTTTVVTNNGVATFSNLIVTLPTNAPGVNVPLASQFVSFTFTIGLSPPSHLAGHSTSSVPVAVVNNVIPNYAIAFSPSSYIKDSTSPVTLTAMTPLSTPIVISMTNSLGQLDPSGNGLVITVVSSDETVMLYGSSATMVNGVATFSNFQLSCATNPIVLSFVAGVQTAYNAAGTFIESGSVSVHGALARRIVLPRPSPTRVATTQAWITITVALLDGCGLLDTVTTNAYVRQTGYTYPTSSSPGSDPYNPLFVQGVATVTLGPFPSATTVTLTLCVGTNCASSASTTITISMQVGGSVVGGAAVAFGPAPSYLQNAFFPVNFIQASPYTFSVSMLNDDGTIDTSDSVTTIAVQGLHPGTMSPLQATMKSGIATFTNAAFTICPVTTVALMFLVGTQRVPRVAAAGTTITTGPINVRGTPADHLQFAKNASYITQYTSTDSPVTVTNMSPLPRIVLELRDSCDFLDASGVVGPVAVSVTGIPGAIPIFLVGGVAVFSGLMFPSSNVTQNVRLTFSIPTRLQVKLLVSPPFVVQPQLPKVIVLPIHVNNGTYQQPPPPSAATDNNTLFIVVVLAVTVGAVGGLAVIVWAVLRGLTLLRQSRNQMFSVELEPAFVLYKDGAGH